jgi:hypothetical protein
VRLWAAKPQMCSSGSFIDVVTTRSHPASTAALARLNLATPVLELLVPTVDTERPPVSRPPQSVTLRSWRQHHPSARVCWGANEISGQ